MAVTKIKATYSVDVETSRELARVAKRWNVSKSEALARAIRAAAALEIDDPLGALDAVQESLRRQRDDLADWSRAARSERRVRSNKREPR